MSPEPAKVQAPAPPSAGAPSRPFRFGPYVFGISAAVGLPIGIGLISLPTATPPPPLMAAVSVAIGGAACFISGHTVLALRPTITDPKGRRDMAQAATFLLLGGVGWVLVAAALWMLAPDGPFESVRQIPKVTRYTDLVLAAIMLAWAGLWALVGFLRAIAALEAEWSRPIVVTAPVPCPRSRIVENQN